MHQKPSRRRRSAGLAVATAILLLSPDGLPQDGPPPTSDRQSYKLGRRVAALGDVDSDGVPDLLVASPYEDSAEFKEAGLIEVFSGKTGKLLYQVRGTSRNENLGLHVGHAGDWNADGSADFAIGAPSWPGFKSAGPAAVVIRSGVDGKALLEIRSPDGETSFGSSAVLLTSTVPGSRPSLAIGASRFSTRALHFAGRVTLHGAPTGGVLWTVPGKAEIPRMRGGIGIALGMFLDPVGDFDGDGVGDLGSGSTSPIINENGAEVPMVEPPARVLSGKDGTVLFTATPRLGGCLLRVSEAGDLNRDGKPDLLVGATRASPRGRSEAGVVAALSGKDGTELLRWEGTIPMEGLGKAIAALGDVNGDGHADIAIGHPYQDVGSSTFAGAVTVHSGKDAKSLHVVNGSYANQELGYDIAPTADLDGDGIRDLLIGFMSTGRGGHTVGLVVSGKTGKTLHELSGTASR